MIPNLLQGIDLGYCCSALLLQLGSAAIGAWWGSKRFSSPALGGVAGFIIGLLLGGLLHQGLRYLYVSLRYGLPFLDPMQVDFILFPLLFILGLVLFLWAVSTYARLPNAVGATRGMEFGPRSQFAAYLERQPKRVQSIHRRIGWLRAAALGTLAGGGVALVAGPALGRFPVFLAALVAIGLGVHAFILLGAVDVFAVKAVVSPAHLIAGRLEFATGRKARFAGSMRLLASAALLGGSLLSFYLLWRTVGLLMGWEGFFWP